MSSFDSLSWSGTTQKDSFSGNSSSPTNHPNSTGSSSSSTLLNSPAYDGNLSKNIHSSSFGNDTVSFNINTVIKKITANADFIGNNADHTDTQNSNILNQAQKYHAILTNIPLSNNDDPSILTDYKNTTSLEIYPNLKPVESDSDSLNILDPSCFIHSKFDKIVDTTSNTNINTNLDTTPNTSLSISHQRLVKTASDARNLAKQLGRASIDLDAQSIMIVTKARDNSLVYLTRKLAYWLIKDSKKTVYVDAKLQHSRRFGASSLLEKLIQAHKRGPGSGSNSTQSNTNLDTNLDTKPNTNLRYWTKSQAVQTPEIFDLAITLGGDGTVLYLSKLFQRVVPPTIAFSLGSLGFLTNFRIEHAQQVLSRVFSNGINVNLRMRFNCQIHSADHNILATHEVLNEIVIDRGPSPWVSMLELYGDGSLLTVVQADGLILSTPTGSTAYSLSAGGSLVHPEVPAVSVTPICPHTLSFRPMLLPDSMVLRVCVPKTSRATAWASFDGHERVRLEPGHYVTVKASQYPFPTIISSPTEYLDSVSRTLKWNVRQAQKPVQPWGNVTYNHMDIKSCMSKEEWESEQKRQQQIEQEYLTAAQNRLAGSDEETWANNSNASFDIDYDDCNQN